MSDDELGAELARLKGTGPRAGFSDEVMRQIAAVPGPRRSWWQRLASARLTLRVSPLQLAGASALAALALVVALRRPPPPSPPSLPAAVVATPPGPTLVRFMLPMREAHAVSVAGDFNGWRPDATPLERGADGVWRATVPLGAGRWSYSFFVDGKWVEDPFADSYREDGFGGRNAIVRVGG
jgi:hypothetical protein